MNVTVGSQRAKAGELPGAEPEDNVLRGTSVPILGYQEDMCAFTPMRKQNCVAVTGRKLPQWGLWHARNMLKNSDTVWKFQKEMLTKADNTILIVGKQATRKLTFIS